MGSMTFAIGTGTAVTTEDSISWVPVLGVLLGSGVVSVLAGVVASSFLAAAETRRQGYAAAVGAVLAWAEYPYRIRRRTSDDKTTLTALADMGHDLQERRARCLAWVAGENTTIYEMFMLNVRYLDVVVDWSQVHIDGLQGAEVPFDAGQGLVGRHHLGGVHLLGANGGADDVQPVQGRLRGDGLGVAGERETIIGNVQDVVLGHLVPADDPPDPHPDLAGTGKAPGIGGDDLGQLNIGGFQQCQAFAGLLGGQGGVTARDQAFPGIVGVGDLGEVGLVEQGHLQWSVVGGKGGERRGS
jgi:hypothetical protein